MPRQAIRLLGVALLAALLAVVGACAPAAGPAGGGTPAAQTAPVKIGEINSYSGLSTVYTFPYKFGLELALDEINDAGGVNGRKLQLVFRDDKLRADEAVKAAQELVFQENVDFIAGCISSSVGLALAEWAKENKVFYFATHCQTSRLTWDKGHEYVARTTNNVNQYIRALASRAAEYPQCRRWLSINQDYEYGQSIHADFFEYLKKLRPETTVVAEYWPRLGETDHTSFITAMLGQEGNADCILTSIWGSQSVTFVKQANPYGLFEKFKLFHASVGNLDELGPLENEAPVGAVTAPFVPTYLPDTLQARPALADWVKRYKDKSGGAEPTTGSAFGYVTMHIIAEAIRRANGSTTADDLHRALSEGFELTMPWGTVIMRGCDQQALAPQWTAVVDVSADGKPYVKDLKEYHGKDLARPCDEVMELRRAAS